MSELNTRDHLKLQFENGDRPTQDDFWLWLDKNLIQGTDNDNIVSQSGNIGIGTASPESPLTISGTNDQDQSLTIAALESTGAPKTAFHIGYQDHQITLGSDYESLLSFGHFHYGRYVPQMTLAANGNLGIGTSDPIDKLHLSSEPDNRAKLRVDGATLSSDRLQVTSDLTEHDYQHQFAFSADANNCIIAPVVDGRLGNSVILSTNGNVGIGGAADHRDCCDESDQLIVHGNAFITGDLAADGVVKFSSATLEVGELKLPYGVTLSGEAVEYYKQHTTEYLNLGKAAIKNDRMRLGEGFTSQLSLQNNAWYTIADIKTEPGHNGTIASFEVTVPTINLNTLTSLGFTVSSSNPVGDLFNSLIIDVNHYNCYTDVEHPYALKSFEKIRLAQGVDCIHVQLLTSDEIELGTGTYTTTFNHTKNPVHPVSWAQESDSPKAYLDIELSPNFAASNQGLTLFSPNSGRIDLNPTGQINASQLLSIGGQIGGPSSELTANSLSIENPNGSVINLSAELSELNLNRSKLSGATEDLVITGPRTVQIGSPTGPRVSLSLNVDPNQLTGPALENLSLVAGTPEKSALFITHPSSDLIQMGGYSTESIKDILQVGSFSSTGFVSHMTILPDGNVGIGVDNPSVKLAVDGEVSASSIKLGACDVTIDETNNRVVFSLTKEDGLYRGAVPLTKVVGE